MIAYKGKGYLGLLVPALFVVVVNLTVDSILGDGYYKAHKYIPAFTVILAGITLWKIGKGLNDKEPRELMDLKTREIVTIKDTHSIFGIPLEYFAGIITAIGILITFAD